VLAGGRKTWKGGVETTQKLGTTGRGGSSVPPPLGRTQGAEYSPLKFVKVTRRRPMGSKGKAYGGGDVSKSHRNSGSAVKGAIQARSRTWRQGKNVVPRKGGGGLRGGGARSSLSKRRERSKM